MSFYKSSDYTCKTLSSNSILIIPKPVKPYKSIGLALSRMFWCEEAWPRHDFHALRTYEGEGVQCNYVYYDEYRLIY